jgi:hypothetical protein
MVTYIGIPAVIILAVCSVALIYGCKKNPKMRAFGLKVKDKIIFDLMIQMMILSSLSFAEKSGFGRIFNYNEERPESEVFQFILISFLLGSAFFFPLFVDQAEKDQFDQFKTTFGVFYAKYRYWNTYASLYLFFLITHRIFFVIVLNMTAVFSLMYLFLMFV